MRTQGREQLKYAREVMKWQNKHIKKIANFIYNGTVKANPAAKTTGVSETEVAAFIIANQAAVETMMNAQPPMPPTGPPTGTTA